MTKTLARVLIALSAVCAASAQAGTTYSVVDIGTLGGRTTATALNDLGQVVGYAQTSTGATQAFLSTHGSIQALGTLGGVNSYAYGINNDGTVVGGSNLSGGNTWLQHAFSYSNGAMSDIAPPINDSSLRSIATGINAAGQVVGNVVDPSFAYGAVFTKSQSVTSVSTSTIPGSYHPQLAAINNVGIAVGRVSSYDNKIHAYTYDLASGVSTDISKPEQWFSQALGINDSGVVVGEIEVGNWVSHAAVYADGNWLDLGTAGKQFSTAVGINNAGQVVGYAFDQGIQNSRAFLYANGSLSFLDTLVDPSLGLTFTDSSAINQLGQIIVNATNGHSYLLSPVPEPAAVVLFLVGLGVVPVAARRRAVKLAA